MNNGDRFLVAFSNIEKLVRNLAGADKGAKFQSNLNHAKNQHRIINQYYTDLQEFADLRNALVHERTDGHLLADPREETVKKIEKIASTIENPKKANAIRSLNVTSFTEDQCISDVLSVIHKTGFSQFPVLRGDELCGILTTNAIACWLSGKIDDDILSLSETSIAEVLTGAEDKGNYVVLSRDANVFDLWQSFAQSNTLVVAVLITHSGKKHEKPIALFTPWDLPEIKRYIP